MALHAESAKGRSLEPEARRAGVATLRPPRPLNCPLHPVVPGVARLRPPGMQATADRERACRAGGPTPAVRRCGAMCTSPVDRYYGTTWTTTRRASFRDEPSASGQPGQPPPLGRTMALSGWVTSGTCCCARGGRGEARCPDLLKLPFTDDGRPHSAHARGAC